VTTTDRLDRVMAYVDGELAPADRAAFDAEMAADPALSAEVEAHRRLAGQLGRAYGPVVDEPVPLRLTLAAQAANEPKPLSRPWIPWAAMAACLAVGVVGGRMSLAPPQPIVGRDLSSRTELARVLDRGLAADAGEIRVGLTFRDQSGRYCRTFQSEPDRLAGLACRGDTGWRLLTGAAWTPRPEPTYRTAASDTPPAVLAAVDQSIRGETFDAAQEKAARDAGWRPQP
jgi:hypothetical protein